MSAAPRDNDPTDQLEDLTQVATDVRYLALVAATLAHEAEQGDTGRIRELGAVIRALIDQADRVQEQADTLWTSALKNRAAMTLACTEAAAGQSPLDATVVQLHGLSLVPSREGQRTVGDSALNPVALMARQED